MSTSTREHHERRTAASAGLHATGLGPAADGLVEQWLGAVEAGLARHVEADPARSIGPLTELVANHPFREGLCALLMTALYHVARQADALAVYRATRQQLVEDLGVEPGPRLRALELQILGHDEELDRARSPSAAGRRGNLPRRSTRLIGRDDEVRVIGEALTGAPVVTLVGPGRIGKTRLALAAAQAAEGAFDDGAWLVELARVPASTDVVRAVADTLDVQESPGRTLTEAVVTALQQRRALLVLDNCEHVIDGAAQLAQAVAVGCPDVHVLATSRERLGLAPSGSWSSGRSTLDTVWSCATSAWRPVDPAFDARGSRGDPLFPASAPYSAIGRGRRRVRGAASRGCARALCTCRRTERRKRTTPSSSSQTTPNGVSARSTPSDSGRFGAPACSSSAACSGAPGPSRRWRYRAVLWPPPGTRYQGIPNPCCRQRPPIRRQRELGAAALGLARTRRDDLATFHRTGAVGASNHHDVAVSIG
jgi:hypothetical protein